MPTLKPIVWTFLLCATLAFYLGLRLVPALRGDPSIGTDEALYVEPSVNYLQSGEFASSGVAPQMAKRGLGGLEHTYLYPSPVPMWTRAALMKMVGVDSRGRRLVDFTFLVFLVGAFYLAARRFLPVNGALLAANLYVLNPNVGFTTAGRPDVLSACFGLLACGVCLSRWVTTATTEGGWRGWGAVFLAGMLVGASGLSHQFGGVAWGLVAATLVAMGVKRDGVGRTVCMEGVLVLGGLAAVGLCVAADRSSPGELERRYLWIVAMKQAVGKNFVVSLYSSVRQVFYRNPFVLPVVIYAAVCGFRSRNAVLCRVFAGLACVLIVWRCVSFETGNSTYAPHYWGVICLAFGAGFGELAAARVKLATLVGVASVAAGFVACASDFGTAYALPHAGQFRKIQEALRAEIKPGDNVLAATPEYFAIPSKRKTLMYFSEDLDIMDYDVVVLSFNPPPGGFLPVCDYLTPPQAEALRSHFVLVEAIDPAVIQYARLRIGPWRTAGCYIFRKSTGAAE